MPEPCPVIRIHAREHGNADQLRTGHARFVCRPLQRLTSLPHHAQPTRRMDIQNVGAKMQQRGQPVADRVGNVMELQIEKDLLPLALQPHDNVPAERIEELHAHLVVTHAVAQTRDKFLRSRACRHIKRRNQPFICHYFTPL